MMKTIPLAVILSAMCFTPQANATTTQYKQLTESSPLFGSVFDKAGKQENIDARLLYAIALVESSQIAGKVGGKKAVKPDPFVLRAPDRIYRGDDAIDSCNKLKTYLPRHKNVVDVGLMQVNVRWNGHYVSDVCHLLDPQKNAEVGAKILSSALQNGRNKTLVEAIGNYHNQTPSTAKNYGTKVLTVVENLVKHGY